LLFFEYFFISNNQISIVIQDYLRLAIERDQDKTINEIGAKPDSDYEKVKNELIEKIEQRYHELLE
jgi:hypothetical protein